MIRLRSVTRGTSPMHAVMRLGTTLSLFAGSAFAFALLGPAGTARAADGCPLTDPSCVVSAADQTAQGGVGEVQGTVNKTLNDLLGPSGGGPGDGGDGGRGSGGGRSEGGRGTTRSRTPGTGSGIATPIHTTGGPHGEATTLHATTDGPGGRAADAHTVGIVRALGEAAVGVAVPILLLLGLAITFTAIQNRLDRRDPKLKLAPLGPDVLRFE
jgi:hypothetical protein